MALDDKKMSQFTEVAALDETSEMIILQGNPIDNKRISKENFQRSMGIPVGDGFISADGSNSNIKILSFDTFTSYTPTITGQMGWNEEEGTMDLKMIDGVTQQIGEEIYFYGKAIENISNRDVIQIAGVQGNHLLFKKAVPAEIQLYPHKILGLATENITSGAFGYVLYFGKCNNVFTDETWVLSDNLYFDMTEGTFGGLTNIEPIAPKAIVRLGSLIKSSTGGAENGIIGVRPSFGVQMKQLNDVYINSILNGQVLAWNSTTNRFEVSSKVDVVDGKSLLDDTEISKLSEYPIIPETPVLNKYLRDDGSFAEISIGGTSSSSNVYLTNTNSAVSGYKKSSYIIDEIETVKSISTTAPNTIFWGEKYLYDSGIGVTTLDSGLWETHLYGRIDNNIALSKFITRIFKYSTLGVETELFQFQSSEINNTVNEAITFDYNSSSSLTILSTDRIGIQIGVISTSVPNRTFYYTIGDGYASHFNTPLTARHSQLRDLNGDPEVQHITSDEKLVLGDTLTKTEAALTYATLEQVGDISSALTIILEIGGGV